MALEDLPEVMIHEKNEFDSCGSPIDFINQDPNYSGKFIVADYEGRKKIMSYRDADAHNNVGYSLSKLIKKEIGDTSFSPGFVDGLSVLGGGYLTIDEQQVKVSGESKAYGEYNPEIVRPIMERFLDRELPNHSLDIEEK